MVKIQKAEIKRRASFSGGFEMVIFADFAKLGMSSHFIAGG